MLPDLPLTMGDHHCPTSPSGDQQARHPDDPSTGARPEHAIGPNGGWVTFIVQ
jgi:hypothetical protein